MVIILRLTRKYGKNPSTITLSATSRTIKMFGTILMRIH